MQIKWGRAARTLFVTVILTLGTLTAGQAFAKTMPPAPATDAATAAPPVTEEIQKRYWNNRCLDTDGYHVYLQTCVGTSSQRWLIWEPGFTKNYRFGTCLFGYPHVVNADYEVILQPCNPNDYRQWWENWSPEWFQNVNSNACLQAQDLYVTTTRCREVENQYWIVRVIP